jgi:lysine 6-dehydrogenase
MKKKALVLGSGMVGNTIAADLARREDLEVTVSDVRPAALERVRGNIPNAKTVEADLGNPSRVTELAKGYDVVCGALPSALGLQTLRAVIEAGKPYSDISFMPEDARELDALAKSKGVTAVVDIGVAPGMSNLLCGHAAKELAPCESLEIYVGGLPEVRSWPYEYKAPFAPFDVIEEYTRPSRIVENSKIVVKPALSEPELMDFPGVGTLEVFNTDGLRSLAYTLQVPNMKEKTMRYPGHIALMRAFRETGLFSMDPIDVKGQKVVPREVTAALLFPKWQFADGEADLTVMRVIAIGKKDGKSVKWTWDLYDRYDPATKTRSMSRVTAFPSAIVAGWLASGEYKNPGVHPPEVLGTDAKLVNKMFAELEKRGVKYAFKSE